MTRVLPFPARKLLFFLIFDAMFVTVFSVIQQTLLFDPIRRSRGVVIEMNARPSFRILLVDVWIEIVPGANRI